MFLVHPAHANARDVLSSQGNGCTDPWVHEPISVSAHQRFIMNHNSDLDFEDFSQPQCVCELTVSGAYIDVVNFSATYFSRDDRVEFGGAGLDYQKVFQLPDELVGICVPEEVADYHKRHFLSPHEGIPYSIGQMRRRPPLPTDMDPATRVQTLLSRLREDPAVAEAAIEEFETAHPVDAAIIEQAHEADKRYQRYGAICGESWRTRFWGTGSNAYWWEYGEQFAPSARGVSLYSKYRCFPGRPRPVLIELARRCPDLWIDLHIWEPNDEHFVFEVRGGHLVREYLAEKSPR